MTLKMALRWKNPDASADINLRFKDVVAKGFLPYQPGTTPPFATPLGGAVITPVPAVLQVTVSPFVGVNYDGAVVTSDATETLTVIDAQVNYVVLRARYRLNDSPILTMQVMEQGVYLADPEINWLMVVGVVDLSVGGPYASVPANKIFYQQRHAVETQARSSWREPVASYGTLPIGAGNQNRDGDIRLALDTGSLYWWDDSLQIWDIFDEVPLITHRDLEHTNGIVAQSTLGSLQPTVSGTDINIAAVPVGSGFTCNGKYLDNTPAALTVIAAGSVGALRGLIQVFIDELGVVGANYRVQKDIDPLDIAAARIVGISDNHGLGAFSLTFSSVGNTLVWNGGLPVPVVTGQRYRLFGSTGLDWVDVSISGVLPGIPVADNYVVNATAKTDALLPIGQYYWDGAATLVLGTDTRIRGNLGTPELADDFKREMLYPPLEELRGNMVYSGGTVAVLAGLTVSVTGPIVAYIQGRRLLVPGNLTPGILLPAASTRFLYVDEAGALVVSATDPTTVPGLVFAEVARLVTDGVTIITNEDRRDPQIIVGNATRDSRVRFTGTASARWNEANTRLVVENNGTTTGVEVETGRLRTTENLIEATTGALTFDDTNTASPQALTAAGEADIAVLQPGNATPSVLGTMRDLQRAKKFAVGVETGCTPSAGAGTTVDIAAGTFYDALGRRISFPGTTNVAISAPLANNVYAIVWDPDLTSSGSFKSVNLTAGGGCEIQDLPFAVVVLNGPVPTAITLLENVVRTADGQYDRSFVTVSGTAAFDEANFNTLRRAMLHVMCFAASEPAPKEIRVVGNLTEPNTAAEGACIRLTSATGFPWAQPSRFSGLKVVGKSNINASPGARPVITWTSTTGPLIDFNATSSDVRGFGFQGVNFSASGSASITDHNRVLFKNISRGFSCMDATIDGNNILSHFVYWTDSVVELGGGVGAVSQSAGVLFQRVFGTQCVDNGGDAIFYFGDNTGTGAAQVTDINGRLTVLDCVFECDATDIAGYFIWTDTEVDTDTGEFDIVIDKTTLSRFQRIFNNCDEAQKLITASTLSDISIGIANGATRQAQITGTVFAGTSVLLTGAGDIVGCSLASTCTLTIASTNRITSCDFSLGTVTGGVGSIVNSVVNLGVTGVLSAIVPTSGAWSSITNSTILKANDNANSNTMLQLSGSGVRCVVTATQFSYTNTAITATTPMISMSASSTTRLVMKGCTLNNPNGYRDSMTFPIVVTSTGDFRLSLDDCTLDMPLGFLQVNRASGTAGEVTITNCVVATSGQNAIDIATGGTGYMASVSITGTKFLCSATDPIYNIFHAKELFVTNNVFSHINGNATYNFGGNTATEGRQDVAVIKGNSFKGTTNGRRCDVTGHSYQKFVYEGNSQSVISVTSTASTELVVTGQAAFSNHCTVSNNQLSCDSDSTGAALTTSKVTVTAFAEVTAAGNSLLCVSSTASVDAAVAITAARAVSCTGNSLRAVQIAAATTAANCAVTATTTAATVGRATVADNNLEVNRNGTGAGTVTVAAVNALTAAIIGNNLNALAGTGGALAARVLTTSVVNAAITGNVMHSTKDIVVLVTGATRTSFVDNSMSAVGGLIDVDLADVSTDLLCSNNTAAASSSVFFDCGTAATDEVAAVGNLLNGNGCTINAECSNAASITGNTLRSSAVADLFASGGGSASIVGNMIYAGTDVRVSASGTLTASVIGNNLMGPTFVAMIAAPTANTGAATVASNVVKSDGVGGECDIFCGEVSLSPPVLTGLMCAVTDNVVRSAAVCDVTMLGAHVASKFRDNVANIGFNFSPGTGTIYAGGNNAN